MLEKVADFLKDHLGNNELNISEQTSFLELGLDSLDLFQLISDFEEKFDITLDIERPAKTVGEFSSILETALKQDTTSKVRS